jgi:hypothetical protein
MLGSLDVTYSGTSLVFNGTPSVSGSLASDLGPADLEDLRPGVQPLMLFALLPLVAGAGPQRLLRVAGSGLFPPLRVGQARSRASSIRVPRVSASRRT